MPLAIPVIPILVGLALTGAAAAAYVKVNGGSVYEGAKRFFCWVVTEALTWMDVAVTYLLGFLPAIPEELGTAVDWFSFINFYFPVETVLWCTFTYLMFCAVIAGLRMVKSFIPTLGG